MFVRQLFHLTKDIIGLAAELQRAQSSEILKLSMRVKLRNRRVSRPAHGCHEPQALLPSQLNGGAGCANMCWSCAVRHI